MSVLLNPQGDELISIPEGVSGSFAVVDLDYLAFKVASVLEDRFVKVYDENDKLIGEYKNRTEFKKSKDFVEEYKVEDCQQLKKDHQSTMVFLLRKSMEDIRKATKVDKVILAAGGDTNFRDRIPSPQKYKGNREGLLRPLTLKDCKELAMSSYTTVKGEDCEADDVISMYQFRSYFDKENRIVAVTTDKDALQTCGYLYNPESSRGMASNEVTLIDGLGTLEMVKKSNKNKLSFSGRMVLYCQSGLLGDSTDNYDPSYLYKKLNGITKAAHMYTDLKCFNRLKECKTDKDVLASIHDQWYEWYKDIKGWEDWQGNHIEGDYIDLWQCYWDYAHMLRWKGDKPKVREILTNLGVI